MHMIQYAYIICYTLPGEAKTSHFDRATALLEEASGLLAGPQGFPGLGAQALRPTQLPYLHQRQETPQLPASLQRQGPATLPLRTGGYGASTQTGIEQRQAH